MTAVPPPVPPVGAYTPRSLPCEMDVHDRCADGCGCTCHRAVPPVRVQLRRTKGWRKPAGAVVVSRPSRWGNPYRVLPDGRGWMVRGNGTSVRGADGPMTKAEAAADAVERFGRLYPSGSNNAYMARIQLAGRDLACWCPLDQPCHADVLLDIANGGRS